MSIMVPAGLYPMGRAQDMTKGNWYIGPICKGCGELINTLEDSSKIVGNAPFEGPGRLDVQCPHCHAYHEYQTSEMRVFSAYKDWKSPTPARVSPSGVTRRSLLESYPNARPLFGPGYLEDRPIAAALVGRAMAVATVCDAAITGLFFSVLGGEKTPAVAAFIKIRSTQVQVEALTGSAKASLNVADYELVMAAMALKAAADTERNRLAHGSFGGCYEIERGVVWMNVDDTIMPEQGSTSEETLLIARKKMYVYEPEDLETVCQQIERAGVVVNAVAAYLGINGKERPERRAERFQSLLSEPDILGKIHELRGTQKASRPTSSRRSRASRTS